MSDRLEVALSLRVPGFDLDVAWSAGAGVAVLFGPSAAAKTLTLQWPAGRISPNAGRIVVDGRVLFDSASGVNVPAQARRVGYVFQGYALFPHLTVAQNVGFGLRGLPPARRAAKTAAVLEQLGLGGLDLRYPRELAGGPRQPRALGRALGLHPALLLP